MTTCFGKETDGYGTGTELEPDTFTGITDGVLVDRGTTHFFSRDELFDVLHRIGFQDINIDYSLYSDRQMKAQHYITTSVKN